MISPVFVDQVAGAWHDDGLSRAMSAAVARTAIVVAALVVALVIPATAAALPGDPGFTATSPADGAALTIDPGGIPVAYTCPVYRVYDAGGGFVIYGGPKDYGVSFASSPTLGPDGRLADPVGLDNGHSVPGQQDACQSAMNPGGSSPRPQETPGTYYWQVWRICTGCPLGYEAGPVLRFTLGSSARPSLKLPARLYGGYPVIATVTGGGLPNGSEVAIERFRAGAWSRVTSDTLVGDQAEITLSLPKGSQRVRVTATAGSQTLVSPEVQRTVRGTGGRRTRVAPGAYRGTTGPGTRSASFRVQGRTLRGFKAFVPMLCPSLPAGQFTTQIGTATIARIRIAPDGGFVGTATPEAQTTIRVRGRLVGSKLTGGRVELSVGTCSGNTSFRVRHA
jgi:hypothetical protein